MDTLSQRYKDVSFVLNMPIEDGLDLIYKALEKSTEERLYRQWLTIYPYMELKQVEFVSFSDYKKNILTPKNKLSVEDMIKQAERIKEADMRGGEIDEDI